MVLLDKVAEDYAASLNKIFGNGIVFGRAERISRLNGSGQKIYTPCYYYNNEGAKLDYVELYPVDNKGARGFFYAGDPQEVEYDNNVALTLKAPMSFIFWCNSVAFSNDFNIRSRDEIKAMILDFFNGGALGVRSGRFTISQVYEIAENVWKGFCYDEIDNQFLTHPFMGFRFAGEMVATENCSINGRRYY